ncbi:hypothetical protein [Buttiauxella sp. A111]|uniref:hypothetical protein n=1 Tax=Buttiauxella sp. A111 TaxID=2563088 RepID=UPI0010E652CF|nr:hypothetical protein [Buttiauxella sp. A111]GDX05310.1 hypothetical protein BSPA111_15010 [Buttiauxella sp. A111]
MNKKTLILLLQMCLLPAALANEQQDFLSSVSELSLPTLAGVAEPMKPITEKAANTPKLQRPIQQTVPPSPQIVRLNNKVANLRQTIAKLESDKKELTRQLKLNIAPTPKPISPNPELSELKQQLLAVQNANQTLKEQMSKSQKQDSSENKRSHEFAGMVKDLASVREENHKLIAQIQEAQAHLASIEKQKSAELSALKSSLDNTQKQNHELSEKLTKNAAIWTAASQSDKQSWALGMSLAGNVRKTLVQLKDLAIPYSEEGLKRGMLAGIVMSAPPSLAVQEDLRELLKNYDLELQKRSKKTIDLIRKSLVKQKIDKQNYSTFFVHVKKGKQVEALDKVLFTLKTETLDGRKLDDVKDKPLNLNTPLPDIILEALDEIGQGGGMTLYCLGADLYTDSTLPAGVFPYTGLKLSLSTR